MNVSAIVTPEDIARAYDALKRAREDLHHAVELLAQRQNDFDRAHAAQVNGGGITGKNEIEREARTRTVLIREYADLEYAKSGQRRAKCDFDTAQIEVDKVQAILTLLGLASKSE